MTTARVGDLNINYEVSNYTDPWRKSDTILLHLFEGYGQGIAFTAPERCVSEMRAFLASL